jgi:hypothetical protein
MTAQKVWLPLLQQVLNKYAPNGGSLDREKVRFCCRFSSPGESVACVLSQEFGAKVGQALVFVRRCDTS